MNELRTMRLSSRAEARSVPNGFSIMTRAQLPLQVWFNPAAFRFLESVRTGQERPRDKRAGCRACRFPCRSSRDVWPAFVTGFIAKLALVIENRLRKRVPDFVAHRLTRKFAGRFFEFAPEFSSLFRVERSRRCDSRAEFAIGREVI